MAAAVEAAEARARRLPGDAGVWLFIAADTFLFALFFSSFMYERTKHVAAFNASQRALDRTVGAWNTLLLLSGSWFVVMAVDAARQRAEKTVVRCLSLAIVCGAAFAVTKVLECRHKVAHGITMLTDDFFMYYFALTGLHFVHLVIGVVVLAILAKQAKGGITADSLRWLESGASYWHMVDLLWIMLFPLLYLVR